MPKVRSDPSSDAISKTALGANVVKQARGKSTTEGFIKDAERVVVRIGACRAKRDHADIGLVHVIFRDEVVAGLGGRVLNLVLWNSRALRPGVECCA